LALTGQNAGSGLDPYPPIAIYAAQALQPGGWLGVEFGAGQAADVAAILEKAGLTDIETFADLSGLARAAFGRRKP
jgi:release factor glutamine methyltransferase